MAALPSRAAWVPSLRPGSSAQRARSSSLEDTAPGASLGGRLGNSMVFTYCGHMSLARSGDSCHSAPTHPAALGIARKSLWAPPPLPGHRLPARASPGCPGCRRMCRCLCRDRPESLSQSPPHTMRPAITSLLFPNSHQWGCPAGWEQMSPQRPQTQRGGPRKEGCRREPRSHAGKTSRGQRHHGAASREGCRPGLEETSGPWELPSGCLDCCLLRLPF